MPNPLRSIGQAAGNIVESVTREVTNIGKIVFTDNRKFQHFGEGAAQLRGRQKMQMTSLFMSLSALAMAGIGIALSVTHPGVANYAMVGVGGTIAAFALREAVIQSVAREKEKKKMGITEENAETTYSLTEFATDMIKGFSRSIMPLPNRR